MTSPSLLSADALHEQLQPGDVLINLTDQELACSVPFVTAAAGQFRVDTGFLAPVVAPTCDQLDTVCASAERLVIVSNDATCALVEELTAAGQAVHWLQLAADCGTDSFMDEADSEAVAERLRQLGYI